MCGTATFIKTAQANLSYHEKTTLTLPDGQKFNGYRSYTYKQQNKLLQCFFADGSNAGRHFHTLYFTDTKTAEDKHICEQDLYHMTYNFTDHDTFTLTYVVTGSRKDYVSKTTFKRKIQ